MDHSSLLIFREIMDTYYVYFYTYIKSEFQYTIYCGIILIRGSQYPRNVQFLPLCEDVILWVTDCCSTKEDYHNFVKGSWGTLISKNG